MLRVMRDWEQHGQGLETVQMARLVMVAREGMEEHHKVYLAELVEVVAEVLEVLMVVKEDVVGVKMDIQDSESKEAEEAVKEIAEGVDPFLIVKHLLMDNMVLITTQVAINIGLVLEQEQLEETAGNLLVEVIIMAEQELV